MIATHLQPSALEYNLFYPIGVLIVDDVLTTGNSMNKLLHSLPYEHERGIVGAVVFARGPCPTWIKPLFQMPPELWITK